jgi:hypothetical protein
MRAEIRHVGNVVRNYKATGNCPVWESRQKPIREEPFEVLGEPYGSPFFMRFGSAFQKRANAFFCVKTVLFFLARPVRKTERISTKQHFCTATRYPSCHRAGLWKQRLKGRVELSERIADGLTHCHNNLFGGGTGRHTNCGLKRFIH